MVAVLTNSVVCNGTTWLFDQLWKTLDTSDSALLERLTSPDVDVASLFHVDREQEKPVIDVEKQRLERFEREAFYLNVSEFITELISFISRNVIFHALVV